MHSGSDGFGDLPLLLKLRVAPAHKSEGNYLVTFLCWVTALTASPPIETDCSKDGGAMPLTIQDLFYWQAISIPAAHLNTPSTHLRDGQISLCIHSEALCPQKIRLGPRVSALSSPQRKRNRCQVINHRNCVAVFC
jgi:hypothetical protein